MNNVKKGIAAIQLLALAALLLFIFSACPTGVPFGSQIRVVAPEVDVFTVTFYSMGGSSVTSQRVTSGGKASRPKNPDRSGYTFDNWYSNLDMTTVYNFATPVTGNVTLYAQWDVIPPPPGKTLDIIITAPSSTLTPIIAGDYTERITVFTISISGFTDNAEANNVHLSIAEVTGLEFSGYDVSGSASDGVKTFTITVTYDGAQAFPDRAATISIMGISNIPSDYTYPDEIRTTSVSIIDGQVEDRAIPVHQDNITAFNIYADTVNGLRRHYKLTENVTLNPPASGRSNWTAIGAYDINNPKIFTGSFDGQENIISNLTINTTTTSGVGMFGCIGYIGSNSAKGAVRNLGLTGGSVRNGGRNTGGVVGWNRGGTVENCYTTGSVTGSVTGDSRTGGVVGNNNEGGTVRNCYATGNVSSSGNYVGGVVGGNLSNSTIENCYATGNVSGNDYLGGVTGYNVNSSTMQNCYASGSVSGNNRVGGVAGWNDAGSTMQNCYATGNISGSNTANNGAGDTNRVGGVVGWNLGKTENCVALNRSISITITANSSIGRVTGINGGTLTNNYGRNPMTGVNSASSTTGIDGADITAANWSNATWWPGTAKFPANAWEFRAGLPTLKNMPAGTQNPTVQ